MPDGRKYRWIDCEWNTEDDSWCTECQVCRYFEWLEWVGCVGKPEGSYVQHNKLIEKYSNEKAKIPKKERFKMLLEIDRNQYQQYQPN